MPAWTTYAGRRLDPVLWKCLSSHYPENDIIAVKRQGKAPRLSAVKSGNDISPLCIHLDDAVTDLFVDPREYLVSFWEGKVSDEYVRFIDLR